MIDSITRTLYDIDPLLGVDFTQFDFDSIIEKYNDRNDRTDYEAVTLVQPLGSAFSTTIVMLVNVPKS